MLTPEAQAIETFLRIPNKNSEDVDFVLNEAQRPVDEHIMETHDKGLPVRMFVPKARQRGVSAYSDARLLIKALTTRNTHARIIAHESKATQILLTRVKYFLKHFKGPKVEFGYNTRNEITFPKLDSSISVYTAGSEEAGRGDFVTHLHASEIAFWPNVRKTIAGLVQAVPPHGEVIYESTGNGAGTWYHTQCLSASRDDTIAQCHFIPWNTSPEYMLAISDEEAARILDEPSQEFEEAELRRYYPELTPEQLAWRRMKIVEFDYDVNLFRQEYPMTLDECFLASALGFFHKVTHVKSKEWVNVDKDMYALKGHPHPSFHYALGVDVAAGVRRDRSVIEVVCYETGEQVFEFASDQINPDRLADVIATTGRVYNWPICVVESNNYGNVTLEKLWDNAEYPAEMVYFDGQAANKMTRSGYMTTGANKHLNLGRLRRALANGNITIFSDHLMGELSTFTDKLKAQEGEHDDYVIALAMANVGLRELPYYIKGTKKPRYIPDPLNSPFAMETIFDAPEYTGQPVAQQVEYMPSPVALHSEWDY